MIIIGISGKKKTGKSAIAEYIKTLYPNRVVEIAFADSLKDEVCQACNVTLDYLNTNKDNFRHILQGWGTDFRRKLCGDDYWIKAYLEKCLNSGFNRHTIIVTPDVRFQNEAMTILKCKGILWRVERLECDIDDQHPSETALDHWTKWDAIIHNNDSLEALKQTINATLKQQNIK